MPTDGTTGRSPSLRPVHPKSPLHRMTLSSDYKTVVVSVAIPRRVKVPSDGTTGHSHRLQSLHTPTLHEFILSRHTAHILFMLTS